MTALVGAEGASPEKAGELEGLADHEAPDNRRDEVLGPQQKRERDLIVARYSGFSGPLPHPRILADYEITLPGCADRIVAMAERQAEHRLAQEAKEEAHRHAQEAKVIDSNCRAQDRGPLLGFALCMGTLLAGTFLIYQGREVSGLVAILTALTAVVVVFVTGKRAGHKEREAKKSESKRRIQVPRRSKPAP